MHSTRIRLTGGQGLNLFSKKEICRPNRFIENFQLALSNILRQEMTLTMSLWALECISIGGWCVFTIPRGMSAESTSQPPDSASYQARSKIPRRLVQAKSIWKKNKQHFVFRFIYILNYNFSINGNTCICLQGALAKIQQTFTEIRWSNFSKYLCILNSKH